MLNPFSSVRGRNGTAENRILVSHFYQGRAIDCVETVIALVKVTSKGSMFNCTTMMRSCVQAKNESILC